MKIEFSKAELFALHRAASEIMDHPEVEQVFPNANTRAAAERAYKKIEKAMKGRVRRSDGSAA